MRGYWNYYNKDYKWDYQNPNINLEYTRSKFISIGMSEEEAEKHIRSGYICLEDFDIVIDRFYGGCLISSDFRTRFPLDKFNIGNVVAKNNVWIKKAKSILDIKDIVNEYTLSNSKRKYLFRGQNSNYNIEREINNPNFIVPEFGEISLLPSLWRVMLNTNPTSFEEFRNLSPMEWSHLLYSKFDLEDIKRREKILEDKGELIFTISEMEDCSDPVLREFGKYRLDLMLHMDNILAPTLITLLQHYGLYSNVLDLTKSLDIAIFFATHKFKMENNISQYDFIGTNKKQSLIYIIREDLREMKHHDNFNETIKPYNPLRPILQECVVATSSTCALNLPADFIEGIIVLDFDLEDSSSILSEEDLFPNEDMDTFLSILKKHKQMKKYLTEFKTPNKTLEKDS